jgi:adenosine deaminase
MSETDIPDWVATMPKVELHVHLEGAIRPETLGRLARRNSIALPASTPEEFREWYRFTDFPHFAEVYQTLSRAIRTPEDLHDITIDFLEEQARQNIVHTEATFTALTHFRNAGLPFDVQIDAIRAARDSVAARLGTSLLLIVDIPRELSTQAEAMQVARWVADAHGDGLVAALGLGGYEVGFPPEMFSTAFALAREAGVPAVVHGGETGGPESVRGAVEALHAVRVGHGVAAIRDPDLVALLRDRQLPLEVCPSSNVCLKVAKGIEDHPIALMEAAGLNVTVNTDDPPIFNTTLNREYAILAEIFGFEERDFRSFNINAAHASLLDAAARDTLACRMKG